LKKIIIFDLDNTFYDYQPANTKALKAVFSSLEIFDTFEKFLEEYLVARDVVKKNFRDSTTINNRALYFKILLMKINYSDLSYAKVLEKIYWDSFIEAANINVKVINYLKTKKNDYIKYHLYTNLNTEIQLKKINKWKLNFFDKIVTSEEAGYEKPHPKFIKHVKADLDLLFQNGFKFYAIGDVVENDLKPWKELYNATTFLINSENKDRNVDFTTTLHKSVSIALKG
jgi:FMN phosphatase YigB (HAD superfamily)